MQIQKYPLKVVLVKKGLMCYFSQLDLTHILERALRRSNLPLHYTQGFNPHNKISFSNGLKLGVRGRISLTFYFSQPMTFKGIKPALGRQLPHGLEIKK